MTERVCRWVYRRVYGQAIRQVVALGLSLVFLAGAQGTERFTLPGNAVYPEGIACDAATGDLYVGSTRTGTVYRGNADAPGELRVFLPGGEDGRTSVTGMKVDGYGRLFVAGRNTGRIFVYDAASGERIRVLAAPPAPRTLLNDVAVTDEAAYVTDSFRPRLLRIPLTGAAALEVEPWLELEGTGIPHSGGFNLNGVAATADGRFLLTVHFGTGQLFRIDTRTKEVREVELGGARLATGDGLLLEDTTLYAVRETPAAVVMLELSDDFTSGSVTRTLTDPSLRLPTTLAKHGDRLLVVNSQLDGRSPELPFSVSVLPLPPDE